MPSLPFSARITLSRLLLLLLLLHSNNNVQDLLLSSLVHLSMTTMTTIDKEKDKEKDISATKASSPERGNTYNS